MNGYTHDFLEVSSERRKYSLFCSFKTIKKTMHFLERSISSFNRGCFKYSFQNKNTSCNTTF
jgi:hypothetical protein